MSRKAVNTGSMRGGALADNDDTLQLPEIDGCRPGDLCDDGSFIYPGPEPPVSIPGISFESILMPIKGGRLDSLSGMRRTA